MYNTNISQRARYRKKKNVTNNRIQRNTYLSVTIYSISIKRPIIYLKQGKCIPLAYIKIQMLNSSISKLVVPRKIYTTVPF